MIHTTVLLYATSKRTIVRSSYWSPEVNKKDISEYLKSMSEMGDIVNKHDLSLIVNNNRYFSKMCTDTIMLIFTTDLSERESEVLERIKNASIDISNTIEDKDLKYLKKNCKEILRPFVYTRLKIALVGEGDVGKTTTLHLLLGQQPSKKYIPTIALDMEVIENIYFGNYSLVIWDFAGQQRFRKLWKFYFSGADIVILLTDSTLRNIIISKDILNIIRKDAPNTPIIAIANKQDLMNAMGPSAIERVLGVGTFPLVAVDIAYRDDILKILLETVVRHVGIEVPDVPIEDMLEFIDSKTIEN